MNGEASRELERIAGDSNRVSDIPPHLAPGCAHANSVNAAPIAPCYGRRAAKRAQATATQALVLPHEIGDRVAHRRRRRVTGVRVGGSGRETRADDHRGG